MHSRVFKGHTLVVVGEAGEAYCEVRAGVSGGPLSTLLHLFAKQKGKKN